MDIGGKLKYVGVELMKKDAKSIDSPEVGLFRGLRTRVEDENTLSLILLGEQDNHDAIRGLNNELFNVMTIMLKYGESREMIVFKNTAEDQKEAAEMMASIIEKLKSDKLMLDSDPDIVDTSKYIELDKDFFGAAKKANVGNNYNKSTNNTTTSTGETWQEKQAREKKEKEEQDKKRWTPFMINRKGDKPAIKDLNLIKKKIAACATGDYVCAFTELEGDPVDDKKTTTATK